MVSVRVCVICVRFTAFPVSEKLSTNYHVIKAATSKTARAFASANFRELSGSVQRKAGRTRRRLRTVRKVHGWRFFER